MGAAKGVARGVKAPYGSIGLYETAIGGILSSSTGWATAAHECVEAAGGTPVVSLGARYVHPNVAANLDYSAIVGVCGSCSPLLGARAAGVAVPRRVTSARAEGPAATAPPKSCASVEASLVRWIPPC